MRMIVFGASGGVGRQLVRQATARGHDVLAVVRRGSAAPPEVDLAWADVSTDPLGPLVEGADVVLSALGMRRRHVWNPWSAVTCAPDFCSASARRIVDAMATAGIDRVIAVSAAGVGDSASGMNPAIRALVASSSIGVAYRDLARMEAVYLDAVPTAWMVRPVTLTDGPLGPTREVDHFGAIMSISRASVAAWMLDRAEGPNGGGTPQIAG